MPELRKSDQHAPALATPTMTSSVTFVVRVILVFPQVDGTLIDKEGVAIGGHARSHDEP